MCGQSVGKLHVGPERVKQRYTDPMIWNASTSLDDITTNAGKAKVFSINDAKIGFCKCD